MMKLDKSFISKLQGRLKLDNKKALLLAAVALVSVIYLDLRFILRVQIQGIKNLNPRISKLRGELKSVSRDLANIQEIKLKLSETSRKNLPHLKKIILDEEITDVLEDISTLANKNEVKIVLMKPSKELSGSKQDKKNAAEEKFTRLLINLDLLCDYHQLGHFINDLENMQVLIFVQEVRIAPQATNYLKQQATLALRTYVRK